MTQNTPIITIYKTIANIFLLKKIRMYSGGVHQLRRISKIVIGAGAAEKPHLILLQVKLDYIPNILPQTGCPAKLSFRLQRGSKLAKSAIFRIFFGFSNITTELFILQ